MKRIRIVSFLWVILLIGCGGSEGDDTSAGNDSGGNISAENKPLRPYPQVLHPLPQVLHPLPQVLHPLPQVLHPLPQVLHPLPQVLHPLPQVLHPFPQALHPFPQALHPFPQALHPFPQVLHPLPQVLHPFPQALHPFPQVLHPFPDSLVVEMTVPARASQHNPITLSGSKSHSDYTEALSYQWDIVEQPSRMHEGIYPDNGQNVRFVAKHYGHYKIKLTVSDGHYTHATTQDILVEQDGDGVADADDLDRDGDGILNSDDFFPDNIAEWLNSDASQNNIGNFAQADEDGDGVVDAQDAYPFDASQHNLFVFNESEFNNNLYPDGNRLNHTYPFKVMGQLAPGSGYQDDMDYFLFNTHTNDMVTFVLHNTCTKNCGQFRPNLSLLDEHGNMVATVAISWDQPHTQAYTARMTAGQIHAFAIVNSNANSSSDFTYQVEVFKDADLDGLSDDLENALGLHYGTPDMDGDHIPDRLESIESPLGYDPDGDGIPSWLDQDSDDDFIPDSQEGVTDIDGDGIANFLDTDADGNGISDQEENGPDPLAPNDTDQDEQLDYLDLDDDNDSLLDINEAGEARITPIPQSEFGDPQHQIILSHLETELQGTQDHIKGFARVGDTILLTGTGFGTSPIVTWQQSDRTFNFKPQVRAAGQLAIQVPQGASDADIRVSNGHKISYRKSLQIVDASSPLLLSIQASHENYVMPGESIQLKGLNFAAGAQVILEGYPLPTTSISGTSIQLTVPNDAVSGQLSVYTTQSSNSLPLTIHNIVEGRVTLPQASTLRLQDLQVSFPGAGSVAVDASGHFEIGVRNQKPTELSIFLPSNAQRKVDLFLSSMVLPTANFVEISPALMAAGLTYHRLSIDTIIRADEQQAAMDILVKANQQFATYLDSNLGQDPHFLADMSNPEYRQQYNQAREQGLQAINQALAEGTLHLAEQNQTRDAAQQHRSSAETGVFPDNGQQHDFSVSLPTDNSRTDSSYNGHILIENNSVLYADYQLKDLAGDKLSRPAINDYTGVYLLAPQQRSNDYIQYHTSDLRLYTGGLQGISDWDAYLVSSAYKQSIRTFVSAAFIPVILAISEINMDEDSTAALINVFASHQLFEGFTADNWGQATEEGIKKAIQLFSQQLKAEDLRGFLSVYLPANDVEDVVGKIGQFLEDWREGTFELSGVGGAVTDLGKLFNAYTTTPHEIQFRAIFPLSVMHLAPTAVAKGSGDQQITILGQGLRPLKAGICPQPNNAGECQASFTFTDTASNSIVDDQAQNAGEINIAHLPGNKLDNMVTQLSLTVDHWMFPPEINRFDLTPKQISFAQPIKLFEGPHLEKLSPDHGIWNIPVELTGTGFSSIPINNKVYFTGHSGVALPAPILSATDQVIQASVPLGAQTGPVWVQVLSDAGKSETNKVQFRLDAKEYTFTYGDNGNAIDDTFNLLLHNDQTGLDEIIGTMPQPTRAVSVTVALETKRYTLKLKGVTAPDAVGTYYLALPAGVSLLSGSDPLTGTDLVSGVIKTFYIQVNTRQDSSVQSKPLPVPILWAE